MKKTRLLILLIVLGAFSVRIWGINFGLPQIQIIDEVGNIYFAFYSAVNRFHPIRYFYGPLIPYILAIEYSLYFVLGKITGFYRSPEEFFISYLSDPTVFVLIGRITFAFAGTIAVWLTWKIGSKFYSEKIGLISSFLLAFTFLHVRESHYIKEDVLAGLFVLATFYSCLRILKNGKLKEYIFAGVFFSLGFAAKYPAGLMLPVFLVAHFLKMRRIEFKKLLVFGLCALLVFFATNPYFALEFKESLVKTITDSGVNRVYYEEHLQGKPVWWWFFAIHIPKGIGIFYFVFALIGFFVSFHKGLKENKYLLIPLLPLLFFTTIDIWAKFHFARYSVMILPFFAISAAVSLDILTSKIKINKDRVLILSFLCLFLLGESLLRVLKFDRIISSPDTRSISARWVEENIPPGSKILAESTIKPEYPSQLSTPLRIDEKSIEKRINDAKVRGASEKYLNLLKSANQGKVGFDIVSTPRVDIKHDIFTSEYSFLESAKYYQDIGVEYLVLSSWAIKPEITPEFERTILEYYEPIAQFNPNPILNSDPVYVDIDYPNLDKIGIFDEDIVFGPVINVYKSRDY